MRIAHSNFYTKFLTDQQRNLKGLENVYSQTASGQKIQYGYEDSHIYIETLRLEQKETTLLQSKEVSQTSLEFSQQTDTVLGQFTDTLDSFKQKLLAAANDIHSESSRMALAQELESLKDHMVNLANTSIAGHYIFSGSLIDQKPFNDDGTYNGNDEDLQALLGSNNNVTYNLSGEDVFLSKDSDYYKSVTSNVQHLNQTKLHPDIMTTANKDGNPEEVYITVDDTIRDMVGDNDDDESNNEDVVFYLRGTDSSGDAVKEKFTISQDDTVQVVLDRIEEAYDQAVTAELNDWGQIVVTDKKSGSSNLDFHLVGAVDRDGNSGTNRADVTDLNDLAENSDVDIVEFMRSNYEPTKSVTNVLAVNDNYDHRNFELNTTLQHNGEFADDNTLVQDILGTNVASLELSGTDTSGGAVATSFAVNGTTTFEDLENQIKADFGDVSVYIVDGKLTIQDKTIDSDGTSQLTFGMKAVDSGANDIVAFSPNEALVMDSEYFTKGVSNLTSNVSQVVKDTGDYATDETNLIDVASTTSLDDNSLSLKITDVNGNQKEVYINLRDDSANQSQSVTAGAGTNTITLDDNFSDLKVGATLKTDAGDYLQVTAIDPDTKQVTLSGATGGATTSVEWLEKYEEQTLGANVAIGDTSATLSANYNNLNVGDTLDLDGENVTITGIDKGTNTVTFEPAATANHASGNTTRYQNQSYSYFSVDGVDYPIYDENYDSVATSSMFDMTSAEIATAVGAGYSKYDQDSVYLKTGELAGAKVGDYLRIGNEYVEIQEIDDNNSVPGRTLIKFDPTVDHVVLPEEEIDLVRANYTTSDEMTFGQVNDIIAMVASGNLPDPENKQPGYYEAVETAQKAVSVGLNVDGQVEVQDLKNSESKIELAMYDTSTNYFGSNDDSPVLTFQSNNALTVDDQHVNFFDRLDEAIEAVTQGIYAADADSSDPRNAGIQNAIKSIDHLNDHMSKMQTTAGTQSQRLQYNVERTEIMVVHVRELRSNVLDADLAEVANELQQRTLNYQAMLASVSKINGLSLVNYM
jgi:flagellar hook-associated protein 3